MTQVDPAFYAAGIVLPGPTSAANATGQIPVWNSTGWDAWIGTWDLTSLTLPQTIIRNSLAVGASVLLNGQSLIYPGTDYNLDLAVQTTYTDGSTSNVGTWLEILLDPAADSPSYPSTIKGQYALLASAATKTSNTKNINSVYGAWIEGIHQSSGTVNYLYGGYYVSYASPGCLVNNNYGFKSESFGGTNSYGQIGKVIKDNSVGVPQAGSAYGVSADVANTEAISSGTDTNYGFAATVLRTGATGGTLKTYGYWSHLTVDNAGSGTHNSYDFYADARSGATSGDNDYYLWFGTSGTTLGVYRIKTDGVMAYYNPGFATAYTPGETNYERIVQQWSSNVAQYGVEAGGTGTLRALQLLGSSFGFGVSPASIMHVATSTTAVGVTIFEQASGDTDGFDLTFRKTRGTVASPTVVTTGDELGTINFSGYSGAAGYVTGVQIQAISEGTIATTRVPGKFIVKVGTNAAPTVLTNRLTIDSSGRTEVIGKFLYSTSSAGAGDVYLAGNSINASHGLSANETLYINYSGYLEAHTQFRDVTVCDGKGNTVLFVDGSNKCVGFGGQSTFGTSADKVIAHASGTAPGSSPADCYQLYSADQAAGNACPHIRTENGATVKLFQAALVADPSGGGTQDAEARTAINSILDLLIANGLMAAS